MRHQALAAGNSATTAIVLNDNCHKRFSTKPPFPEASTLAILYCRHTLL